MDPNIGISKVDESGVVKILNTILADEFVIYVKTLNFHWNITGHHFHSFHIFFENQYLELAKIIDEVAERVRAVGGRSHGSMTSFLQYARLEESPGLLPSAEHMVQILLDDHEALIRHLRTELRICNDQHNDVGTNNFLTDLMEKHEKMAWMLRATLVKKD